MTELTTLQTDYEAKLAAAKACLPRHMTYLGRAPASPTNLLYKLTKVICLRCLQAATQAAEAAAAFESEAAAAAMQAAADAAAADLEQQKRLLQVRFFYKTCPYLYSA